MVAPHSAETIARFWAKVDRSGGPDACWPYSGPFDEKGYGQFGSDYKNLRSNRVALEIELGEPLDERYSLHHCDNPPCCNPSHLYTGDAGANIHDCINRGRFPKRRAIRSNCNRGHPLSGDNLVITSIGRRTCRQCVRAKGRRHDEKRRLLTKGRSSR